MPDTLSIDLAAATQRMLALLKVPGHSREEGAVQALIQGWLKEWGIAPTAVQIDNAHKRIPGGGAVGNLIVKLPGTHRGPRRLLMAHLDTVPICVGADPFVDGDRIRSRNPATGLGGDDRAGIGAMLTALYEIQQHKLPHPPLTFFFAVQEEIGLYGARFVSLPKLGKPALCFNFDGGEPEEVCIGATGDYALKIEITGLASHAGVHPELGVSAATIAGLAIADLHANGWLGLIVKGKRRGTSNIGVLQGGEATNVVLPALTLRAEARSHDPEFRKVIVDAFRKAFSKAAKSVRSADGQPGSVLFEANLQYESFRLPSDSPVIASAQAAIRAVGLEPSLRIANGGLDANWMSAHGLPTVTLGCGQHDIHTVKEWLSLPEYHHACRIAVALATGAAE